MESALGWKGGDGWIFTHSLSGTTEINECVLLLLLSHTHKHSDSHSRTGLSADLFPLTLSSAEIWTSDKKYKEDVSLKVLTFSLLFSLFPPSPSCQSQHVCLFYFLTSFFWKYINLYIYKHIYYIYVYAPLSSHFLQFVTLMRQIIKVLVAFYILFIQKESQRAQKVFSLYNQINFIFLPLMQKKTDCISENVKPPG